MKKIFVIMMSLALAGCDDTHKEPAGDGSSAKEVKMAGPENTGGSTSGEKEAGNGTDSSSTEKPFVFVGIFARWNMPDGEQYDGTYDTVQDLFVFCSNHQCQPVRREQIIFQEFGNCDTALSSRIMMFEKKGDHFEKAGDDLKFEGNKAIIKKGAETKMIQLDEPTMKRINKAYTTTPAVKLKEKEMMKFQPAEKETGVPVKPQAVKTVKRLNN